MNSTERPNMVNIVGWFLVVTNALPLVTTTLMLMMPAEDEFRAGAMRGIWAAGHNITTLYLFSTLLVLSGVGILKRLNWGRTLFIAVWPARLAAWVIISGLPMIMIPMFMVGVVGYIFIIVVLTRPEAVAVFRKQD